MSSDLYSAQGVEPFLEVRPLRAFTESRRQGLAADGSRRRRETLAVLTPSINNGTSVVVDLVVSKGDLMPRLRIAQ